MLNKQDYVFFVNPKEPIVIQGTISAINRGKEEGMVYLCITDPRLKKTYAVNEELVQKSFDEALKAYVEFKSDTE